MDRIVLSVPTDFIHDKRKDDWKLIADVPFKGNPTLELAKFLKTGETYVNGEVMLSRAKKLGNMAGQRHAERMLVITNQIPESWRAFYLVFPGTVWQDAYGRRYVPYLYWLGGEWRLRWGWLDGGWDRSGRLVRLSK